MTKKIKYLIYSAKKDSDDNFEMTMKKIVADLIARNAKSKSIEYRALYTDKDNGKLVSLTLGENPSVDKYKEYISEYSSGSGVSQSQIQEILRLSKAELEQSIEQRLTSLNESIVNSLDTKINNKLSANKKELKDELETYVEGKTLQLSTELTKARNDSIEALKKEIPNTIEMQVSESIVGPVMTLIEGEVNKAKEETTQKFEKSIEDKIKEAKEAIKADQEQVISEKISNTNLNLSTSQEQALTAKIQEVKNEIATSSESLINQKITQAKQEISDQQNTVIDDKIKQATQEINTYMLAEILRETSQVRHHITSAQENIIDQKMREFKQNLDNSIQYKVAIECQEASKERATFQNITENITIGYNYMGSLIQNLNFTVNTSYVNTNEVSTSLLLIKNTQSHTVTWDTKIKWSNNQAPTISSNGYTLIALVYFQNISYLFGFTLLKGLAL